ncbi:MAG: autotransporter-associated beta strand repeat-containing protein, partial [Thermoguttaceae bacterium]|nr:autotransporter-associated beta strand repeat-containing protein [Thermoguttaceae bacterium]
KTGAGTMELTAVNTISGKTTISAGKIKLTGNGTLGTGAVVNNATLEFAHTSDITSSNAISGSGVLLKTGTGTLTLSNGGSSYTGNVFLDGGKISVSGKHSGSNSALGKVQSGRTINVNSGTELIFANQDVFTDAHTNNPVAIVVDGGKISNSGAYYNFLQDVTLKNGANIHAANGNTTWEAYKFQNINVVSNTDGSAATAPTITGANNDHAVISFGAKSDDVATKPSTIYVENITNNANSDLVISAKIVNATTVNTGVKTAGEIYKTGAGTLELKNINSSYSGNLTIKEGTVKVTAGSNADNRTASALGASNVAGRTVTINSGAVLELAAQDVMCDTHSDTKLLFVVDGGKITNSGANFNFLQNVTLKNGANIYASNGNTNWEAYKIQNLRVERSGDAAASAVSLTAASGDHNVFTFGAISDNISTVPVSIYVEDITSSAGSSDTVTDILISAKIVDANIDGKTKKAAQIVKSGAGTLELKNAGNTFSGNMTIDEGTVKLTAGSSSNNRTASALGSGNTTGRTITVNDGAILDFAVQDVIVNAHSDTKLTIVVDGGQIINTDACYNNLQNLVFRDGGSLYASDGHATWKAYKLHNVTVERNADGTAGAPVTFSADPTMPNATIAFGAKSDTLTAGTSVSTINVGEITSSDASVNDNVSDLVISAIVADPLVNSNGTSKPSAIEKTGTGTMELTAANTITGKTTISEGTLKLSGDGTLGSGAVAVGENATLEFAHESDQTFNNAISGTGAVTKTGSGTLTLSGADTHTGETTVSAGTLKYTGNALPALVNKSTGVTYVESDGTLEYNVNTRVAPVRLSFSDSNKISSTGEVVKTGDGTLQLYSAASGAIDIRSLTVSSGRVEILGALTNGITVEPGSVFSPGVSSSASVTDVPAVVGHRGNSSVAPENTLSAYRSCIDSGAQGAECDVYRTKDGYLVLQHDSTLSRNVRDADGNPVEGRIADYTLDELLTMDFGVWKGEEFRGEKVATLDQYLDLLNGTNCAPVIELKQTGLEADTISAVRERGMEDETTIIAFSEAAIKECRRLAPEIKAAWLCTKNSSETVDQYADRIIAKLQELDTTYVDLESSPVTPELVQKLHDNGITVMTWTVDNPDRVTELYYMGIDSVTTNVPVTGMELLDSMTGSGAQADNAIGKASFGGEFVLNQGATLLLEQDETGMDQLTASSFNIDSDSILELVMGSFKPGAEYPIIVNSSGAFGVVDGVDYSDASFWTGILTPESDVYWDLFVRGNTVYASIEGEAPTPGSGVPEPSTWALLALGFAGLLYVRRRNHK